MNWPLLIQSFGISASVALISALIGAAAALCLSGAGRWARTSLLVSGVVVPASPPFLMTNALLDVASFGGAREWLPFSAFSAMAATLVMSAMYWPITMLALWAAWSRLERPMLEADPMARGRHFIGHLLLPLGRGALVFAFVLTFVLALNNFSVCAVLQAKTYPVEVWIAFSSGLSAVGALMASLPLIIAPVLLLAALVRRNPAWPRLREGLDASAFRGQAGPGWIAGATMITGVAVLVSLCFPLVELIFSRGAWRALPGAFEASGTAALNSLLYAALSALVCAGVGLFLALQAGPRWPWLLWLLVLIPGTILGIGFAMALGIAWLRPLRDSAAAVVLVLAARFLALSWGASRVAIESADPALADVAALDGATLWQRVRHVYWPQSGTQMLAGAYFVYLFALWEVESILPVVPPGGDTLAMRVFNLLHYGHTPEVNGLCLVLLGIALLPLVAYGALQIPAKLRRSRALPGMAAVASLLAGCSTGEPDPITSGSLSSRIFSRAEVIGSKGAGLGQFTKPRSLAVDAHDNLYVADMTGRIQKFTPDGVFLLSWQMPQTDLGRPKGMCRDAEGDIVVIEPHYSRINHFDASGSLRFQWGSHGTNTGELAFPRAAAANTNGSVYVSEYGLFERIQRFETHEAGTNRTMRLVSSFGAAGTGPGQFNRPEGLGMDAAGNVFVADSCNHRIQVFDASGQVVGSFGKAGRAPGEVSYPYDVAVDRGGLRFVCEFGNSRIQVFDQNNKPLEVIGGPGSAPGEFNNPWAVALDSRGNLYVADALNHRVQKLARRN
jgi:ABC-type Fe3+ transport system permease subunit/sugar lactone lactonase YvrE